jgi:hypothetical protein
MTWVTNRYQWRNLVVDVIFTFLIGLGAVAIVTGLISLPGIVIHKLIGERDHGEFWLSWFCGICLTCVFILFILVAYCFGVAVRSI